MKITIEEAIKENSTNRKELLNVYKANASADVINDTNTEEEHQIKISSNYRYDPNKEQVKNLIYFANFPNRWRANGISAPNISCKKLTEEIILNIYDRYSLSPLRITTSIEGGMFFNYFNFIKKKELAIEVYNELDWAAIFTINNTMERSYDGPKKNIDRAVVDFIAS